MEATVPVLLPPALWAAELAAAAVDRRRMALRALLVPGAVLPAAIDFARLAHDDADDGVRRAAARVAALATARAAPPAAPTDAAQMPAWFAALPGENARGAFLAALDPQAPASAPVLAFLHQELARSREPWVLEAGLHLLAGRLVASEAGLARSWLDAAEPGLAAAALLALAPLEPAAVRQRIPSFLSTNCPDHVAAALQVLTPDDPTEVHDWCRALLGESLATTRHAGLRVLLGLPADLRRDLLLRLLADDDSDLLAALAATALVDLASPGLLKHVLDIEACTTASRQPLFDALLPALEARLAAGGQLDESFAGLVARTRHQTRELRNAFTRRVLCGLLHAADTDSQVAGVLALAGHLASTEVRDELAALGRRSSDPRVLLALGRPLAAPATGSVPVLAEGLKQERFAALTLDQQLDLLGRIDDKQSFALLRPLLPWLLAGNAPVAVRQRVLVLLERCGDDSDPGLLLPLLDDPAGELATLAVGMLGRLAPTLLTPERRARLRAHPDPRVRAALVEPLVVLDRRAALPLLSELFTHGQRHVRALALAAASRLDHPSTEPFVLALVGGESDAALRGQATYWAAMNPTADGINLLYRLCHDDSGTTRQGLADVWRTTAENARKDGWTDLEPEALARQQRTLEERRRKREQEPAPWALGHLLASPASPAGEGAVMGWARRQPLTAALALGGFLGLLIFGLGWLFLKYSESRLDQFRETLHSGIGTGTGTGFGSELSPGTGRPAIPTIDLTRFVERAEASGTPGSFSFALGDGREELREARELLASGERELALGLLESLAGDATVATATRGEARDLLRQHASAAIGLDHAASGAATPSLPATAPVFPGPAPSSMSVAPK